MACL
jgi:hypothetical protein